MEGESGRTCGPAGAQAGILCGGFARMRTVAAPATRLDEFLPNYHISEIHATQIHGSPAHVFAAVKSVTAEEVFLLRTVMAVRALPARLLRKTRPRLTAGAPLLDQFLRGGFLLLAEVPDRELVVGRIGQFWKLSGGAFPSVTTGDEFRVFGLPGFAKAVVNFLVTGNAGGGVRLSTETRVYLSDPVARRKFGLYWRLISPGSAFIRLMWLKAVKRRVESLTARGST